MRHTRHARDNALTDTPSPIRHVTLEGGPLDGRTLYWSGGRVMDVPVIAGTTDLPGATRNVEEGEEVIEIRYVADASRPDLYVYAGGEGDDPA